MSAADLFLRNAENDDVAAHFEDRSHSYRELVAESLRRAALWNELRDTTKPPHIGVLLDNTAEYLFWLGAAAISRSVVVGINATYRGAELTRLIDHCDCQVLVTSGTYDEIFTAAPTRMRQDRVLRTHGCEYGVMLDGVPNRTWDGAREDDLFLLIFTSGSTGFPKAVRCTQGRFARTGMHVAGVAGLGPGSAVYSPLPFFHTSALFTGIASALHASVPIGSRARISASRTMPDIRRMGATMLTHTGKVLSYILAVPPSPASMKIDKTRLRREAWLEPGTYWRPARGTPLRRATRADLERLTRLLR